MKKYLLIFLFLIQWKSYAQSVIYTDIIPDTAVANSTSYNIDLNHDGVNDFTIFRLIVYVPCGVPCGNQGLSEVLMTPASGSEILDGSLGMVSRLNFNTTIGNQSQTWSNDSNQLVFIYGVSCNQTGSGGLCVPNGSYPWLMGADYYSGVRILVGGHFYYGWIRIRADFGNTVLIKDYAYNSIPDSLIYAGDIAAGIDNNTYLSTYNVFPNPATDKLYIINSINQHSEFSLYDITSRIILKKKFESSLSLDIEHLETGMYIYEIRNQNGVIKKGKFIKTNR